MLSFGTKINLILFLISVLVALYLFVMQKEIRLMQNDISEMRTLVDKLMKSKFNAEQSCKAEAEDEACIFEPLVVFENENDDDDDDDEDDVSEDVPLPPAPAPAPVTDGDVSEPKSKKASKSDITIDGDVETILKTIDSSDEHMVKLSSTKTTKKRKAPSASKN